MDFPIGSSSDADSSPGLLASLVRAANKFGQRATWRKLDVAAVVDELLQCINASPASPPDPAWQDNLSRNRILLTELEALGPRAGKKTAEAAEALLELIGYGDWRGDAMLHVQREGQLVDRKVVVDKVVAALKGICLAAKPAKPTVSRWTGVPNVACFVARLSAIRNLFGRLLVQVVPVAPTSTEASLSKEPDAQKAEADAYRKEQAVRYKLLKKWVDKPLSSLSCFLVVVANRPIRRLLHFFFKHEPGPKTQAAHSRANADTYAYVCI